VLSSQSDAESVVQITTYQKRANRCLSDRLYYCLLLNHFGIEDIMSANFLITVPSLLTQLMQPEYFDIKEDEVQFFNSLFISLYTAGYVSGGVLNSYLGKRSRLSHLRIHLRIAIILSIFASLSYDKSLLLTMRFFQGFCVGVLHPNNIGEAFRMSPKRLKGAVGNFFSFYFAVGILLGMLGIYFSNLGWFHWHWVFLGLAGLEALSIMALLLYLGVDLSFFEHLQAGDESRARSILLRYVKPAFAVRMIEEEKQFIGLRTDTGRHRRSACEFGRELLITGVLTLVLTVSFSFNYSSNLIVLTCKDPKNIDEAQAVSMLTTAASVAELLGKTVQLFVPALNRRRRLNMMVGFSGVSLMWLSTAYLYHIESWSWVRICIIPWFFIIGFFIFPPYYSILSDVLTGDLLGVILALGKLAEIGSQFGFAVIIERSPSSSSFRNVSLFFAAAGVAGVLFMAIFFFETHGLTKVQIHQKLRGRSNAEHEQADAAPASDE